MRAKTSFLLVALIGVVVGHLDDFDPWLLGLSVAPDSAGPMLRKFLARMARSIESKDRAVIAGLFRPEFVFKGCFWTLNKNEVIAHLSGIPGGTKVSLNPKIIRDRGENIIFTLDGFKIGVAGALDDLWILNKQDQQLLFGSASMCPKSSFFGVVGQDSSLHEMVREVENFSD